MWWKGSLYKSRWRGDHTMKSMNESTLVKSPQEEGRGAHSIWPVCSEEQYDVHWVVNCPGQTIKLGHPQSWSLFASNLLNTIHLLILANCLAMLLEFLWIQEEQWPRSLTDWLATFWDWWNNLTVKHTECTQSSGMMSSWWHRCVDENILQKTGVLLMYLLRVPTDDNGG